MLRLVLACVAAAGCAATDDPSRAGARRSVVVYAGQRQLDGAQWGPVEDQPTLGAALELVDVSGLGLEFGLLGSFRAADTTPGMEVQANTLEAFVGGRFDVRIESSPLVPYAGLGLSVINADARRPASNNDASAGLYMHAGVDWLITDSFFLGLDLRLVRLTDVTIAGTRGDVDYDQLAAVIGFTF